MNEAGHTHRAKDGDSIGSLAYEQGLFWKSIWDHTRNTHLRDLERDPCCLAPGDEIFLPARRMKLYDAATNHHHRFRRRGIPSVFRMRIFREPPPLREESERDVLRALAIRELILAHPEATEEDVPEIKGELKPPEPWANAPFVACVDGSEHQDGRTNKEGILEIAIAPNAKSVRITIAEGTDDEQIIEAALGYVDPIETDRGVWHRLSNLGFPCGATFEEFPDHREQSVILFQIMNKLQPTGELDDETRDSLRKAHGR